jgi:hypothetical protein
MRTATRREGARPKRRIAADEAHSWARDLRLNNPLAKLVLLCLTQYVNGDGVCYVGIDQLSLDCELVQNTIRNRLGWLERIGVLQRHPRWIDGHGNRTPLATGRRTTDDIQLMIYASPDEIEDRAAGYEPAKISPARREGLIAVPDFSSAAPALQQPCSSVQGLTSEPEPEPESPPAPSGGEGDLDRIGSEESEPEHFGPSWLAYPGHELMRRDLALAEFRQLSAEQQKHCRAAIAPFVEARIKAGRTKPPMNFNLWIKTRGFDEFPNATLAAERPPPPPRRFVQGDELAGMLLAYQIAEQRQVKLASDPQLGNGLWTTLAPQSDLAALAAFAGEDPEAWQMVEVGSAQFAAWRDRLALWLRLDVKPERIWLEPYDAAVHGLSPMHPDFKLRKSKSGFRVPAPWPPHRDGSWPAADGDAA